MEDVEIASMSQLLEQDVFSLQEVSFLWLVEKRAELLSKIPSRGEFCCVVYTAKKKKVLFHKKYYLRYDKLSPFLRGDISSSRRKPSHVVFCTFASEWTLRFGVQANPFSTPVRIHVNHGLNFT